ncbi:hypothetical protein BJY52DRAFT_1330911 [Lactarius psammicola]|nr:hypothetical protein BJY52DRAFT_1330911 [Lactarius psammicola]
MCISLHKLCTFFFCLSQSIEGANGCGMRLIPFPQAPRVSPVCATLGKGGGGGAASRSARNRNRSRSRVHPPGFREARSRVSPL